MIQFEDALARLLEGARAVTDVESIATMAARGRVLARDVVSGIAVPARDVSMMDGYCVRVQDVAIDAARLKVGQRIPAGSAGATMAPGTCARIFTGAPIPPGGDAVVMQELTSREGDVVTINHRPQVGEWITKAGADIQLGATVLAAGTRLRAQDMGLAASVGLPSLSVYRRLRVALLSTGSELFMPGQPLPDGGIYNSNRFMLRGLLEGLGCVVADLGIVPDQLEATRVALRQAAVDADIILTCGGVSVGEEDHVRPAVQAEGSLDMWKVAIKPGKPLAFGKIADAAFIGLPGNPVSSFVTFLMLVRPYLLRRQGAVQCLADGMVMRAGFDWPGPDGRREFLRARRDADGALALFANQSSAVLTSTSWADGLVDVPPGVAIRRGDEVRFIPFAQLLH